MSSHEKVPPSEDEGRTHATHKETSTQVCERSLPWTWLTDAEQYPSVSLYQPGDKVWHSPPNERSMVGPLRIVAHQSNEMYTLADVNTGQSYNGGVSVSYRELQRV